MNPLGWKRKSQISPERALELHGDMVYRLAVIQMKNQSEAEDVFQEVFLRLVKYKDRIENEEHLKAWLIRVTLNCCKKQFDNAYRRKTVPLDMDVHDSDSYEIEQQDDDVYGAVQALPQHYKEVIHLFYYEEYSIKEICEILDLKESAVKTRLSRARDILRTALKGGFADAERV